MSIGNEFKNAQSVQPWNEVRENCAIEKIEQYWERLRAGRLIPSRCEVDPRELEGVLGNTFVLERIAPGLARFRIAGSHIVESTGLELRQMPTSVLFGTHSRGILSEALEAVFDEPAAVHMHLMSKGGFAEDDMKGELILLPLRNDTGEVNRVLGGIAMNGTVGRKPRRLEITRQARKTLTGFAGSAHSAPRPRIVSESMRPLECERSTGAHLKLVVSND